MYNANSQILSSCQICRSPIVIHLLFLSRGFPSGQRAWLSCRSLATLKFIHFFNHAFIRSFIRSFILSFILHPLFYIPVRSSSNTFISFIRLFIHSFYVFVNSYTRLSTLAFIRSFTWHPSVHSLTRSLIHSLIYIFTRSFIHMHPFIPVTHLRIERYVLVPTGIAMHTRGRLDSMSAVHPTRGSWKWSWSTPWWSADSKRRFCRICSRKKTGKWWMSPATLKSWRRCALASYVW